MKNKAPFCGDNAITTLGVYATFIYKLDNKASGVCIVHKFPHLVNYFISKVHILRQVQLY